MLADGRTRRFTALNESAYRLSRQGGEGIGQIRVEQEELIGPSGARSFVPTPCFYLRTVDDAGCPCYLPVDSCRCSVGRRLYAPEGSAGRVRFCIDMYLSLVGAHVLGAGAEALPNEVHLVFDALVQRAREDETIGDIQGIVAERIGAVSSWSHEGAGEIPVGGEGTEDAPLIRERERLAAMDRLLRAREAACAPHAVSLYDWRPPLFSPSRIEALRDAVGLSVEELYSLPAPASQAAVQQNAFASLVTMGFAKADQELLNVFGRVRPTADLTPREAALADEHEAYLRDRFMNGYGCWGLSDMEDSYVRDLLIRRIDGASGWTTTSMAATIHHVWADRPITEPSCAC